MSFRSLREPSILDMMVQFSQEWLVLRLPPAKPVNADLVPIKVRLHSHQPMQPVRVHLEAPAQHLHCPHRTGPPQGDNPTPGSRPEAQLPAFRKGTPTTLAVTLASTGHEAGKPPCREVPLSTSIWGPPLITSPSTTSKLSRSRRFEATSGRCQPGGGAGVGYVSGRPGPP